MQSEGRPDRLRIKYLLLTTIPCERDENNDIFTDNLWCKDISEHLLYLDDFVLAAPLRPRAAAAGTTPPPTAGGRFRYAPLPFADSRFRALRQLPATVRRVWAEVRSADVVHVGIAGWPYPLGWLAVPLARLHGKLVVSMVESAPWRPSLGTRQGLLDRIVGVVYEFLSRACVRAADLALFTQPSYRDEMLGRAKGRGHVIHASWIDAENVRPEDQAVSDWDARLSGPQRPLSVLFAGRLTADKGVRVLLDAAGRLAERGVAVRVDLLGAGDLTDECRQIAAASGGGVHCLGTREYGRPFFEAIAAADVVVVPSLGDEQPRVVYDAFSQGVPVVASDTTGLRACVQPGANGLLVPPGDPAALADALAAVAADRPQLRRLGLAALGTARGLTHREMHRRRWVLLNDMLRERREPGRSWSAR